VGDGNAPLVLEGDEREALGLHPPPRDPGAAAGLARVRRGGGALIWSPPAGLGWACAARGAGGGRSRRVSVSVLCGGPGGSRRNGDDHPRGSGSVTCVLRETEIPILRARRECVMVPPRVVSSRAFRRLGRRQSGAQCLC
jgi:hypothetical protein